MSTSEDDLQSDQRYDANSPRSKMRGHLKQALERYGDPDIYFCGMEGPIHRSHCVYCRHFTGKAPPGDASKRRPTTCTNLRVSGHSQSIGAVIGDEVVFDDQETVQNRVAKFRLPGSEHRLRVPISEAEIKSALNPDVTRWDFLRFSVEFCARCGPDETIGVHYRCKGCGTLALCDNCLENRREDHDPDQGRTVYFNCPDCGHSNEDGLGKNDCNATIYSVHKDRLLHRSRRDDLLPIEYGLIKQRLSASDMPGGASPVLRAFSRPPHPDAKLIEITRGMLAGRYWVHESGQAAWKCLDRPDWRAPLFARTSAGLPVTDFVFDVTLSYRTEAVEAAEALRTEFEDAGLSVFMIVSASNVWDDFWAVRFAEAIFRSRHLAFLPSPSFFDSGATRAELEEFFITEDIRNALGDVSENWVSGLPPLTGEAPPAFFAHLSETTRDRTLSHIRPLQEIVNELRRAPAGQHGLRHEQVYEVTFGDLTDGTCPTCEKPVFFDDEVRRLPAAEQDEVYTTKEVALACVRSHRFCSACDARQVGGMMDCCPKCHTSDGNVKGGRMNRAMYQSSVIPLKQYGTHNPRAPECLHCSSRLGTAAEAARICVFGHRHCDACRVNSSEFGGGLCPECAGPETGRTSVSARASMDLYFFGSRPDLPIQVDTEDRYPCFICLNDEVERPIAKFKDIGSACRKCLQKLERDAQSPHHHTDYLWSGFREQFRVTIRQREIDIPTCGVCEAKGSETPSIAFTKTNTLGDNFIFALCSRCLDEALNLLTQ